MAIQGSLMECIKHFISDDNLVDAKNYLALTGFHREYYVKLRKALFDQRYSGPQGLMRIKIQGLLAALGYKVIRWLKDEFLSFSGPKNPDGI